MAHFTIDVTADGVNNAVLVGPDTDYMVPGDSHIDVLIWNASETDVTVNLVTSHQDLYFSQGAAEHDSTHGRSHYRSTSITNGTALGSFFTITALDPHSVYPIRITNIQPSPARDAFDEDSCTLQTAGHGTNIYNGQYVWVIPYRPLDA